jgi:hypothetical protein
MKKLLQSKLKIFLFSLLFVTSNMAYAQVWDVYSNSLSMGRDVIYTSDSFIVATGTPSSFSSGVSMKMDLNGNLIWTKPYGGFSVCETFDKGFIVASCVNYTKAQLRKLDSNGNLLWDSLYGGPGQSEIMSVIQASDSGIVACGFNSNYGDSSIYIMKTDKDGNFLWQQNIYALDFGLAGEVVELNNKYYIIGYSGYSSNQMIAFICLEPNGTLSLRKDIALGYRAQAIAPYDENSFVVCGQSSVTKINLSGDTIWHKQFNGQMFHFQSIDVTENKNIVISGSQGYLVGYDDFEHNMMLVLNAYGSIVFSKTFIVAGNHISQSLESVISLSNTDFVGCGYVYKNDTIKMRVLKYHNITSDIPNNYAVDKSIVVYPNPTTDKVVIDVDGLKKVQLFNGAGKLLQETNNNSELDLSAFPKGFYFLKVFTEKGIYIEKIILQ